MAWLQKNIVTAKTKEFHHVMVIYSEFHKKNQDVERQSQKNNLVLYIFNLLVIPQIYLGTLL